MLRPHGRKRKTNKSQCQIMVRRQKVLDLRIKGLTLREIAKELGISYQTAFDDIKQELAEMTVESRNQLRKIKLEEYAATKKNLAPEAFAGDEKKMKLYLEALAAERKMFGLDDPATVDLTSDGKPLTPVIVFGNPKQNEDFIDAKTE